MKTWRWTLLLVSAGALAFACSVEDNSTDDDSTTSENTTTSSTGGSTNSVAASTVSTVASTTGGNTCASQATFQACAQCFCQQNMSGCQTYINAITDHIYCGTACGASSDGMECAEYCADPMNVDPAGACDMCTTTDIGNCNPAPTPEGTADCDAFFMACEADMTCVQFANDINTCPDA